MSKARFRFDFLFSISRLCIDILTMNITFAYHTKKTDCEDAYRLFLEIMQHCENILADSPADISADPRAFFYHAAWAGEGVTC